MVKYLIVASDIAETLMLILLGITSELIRGCSFGNGCFGVGSRRGRGQGAGGRGSY
ncbi:MAG: hypothetical protein ACRAVC_08825 [Trichormus sp.]